MIPESRHTGCRRRSNFERHLALEVLTIGAVLLVMLDLVLRAIGSVALPLAAAPSLHASRSSLRTRTCLVRLLHTELPSKGFAYFGPQSADATQELLELDYGWAHPVPSSSKADWLVSIHPDRGPGSCDGVGLQVTRIP
jgi:hypothetical protein